MVLRTRHAVQLVQLPGGALLASMPNTRLDLPVGTPLSYCHPTHRLVAYAGGGVVREYPLLGAAPPPTTTPSTLGTTPSTLWTTPTATATATAQPQACPTSFPIFRAPAKPRGTSAEAVLAAPKGSKAEACAAADADAGGRLDLEGCLRDSTRMSV